MWSIAVVFDYKSCHLVFLVTHSVFYTVTVVYSAGSRPSCSLAPHQHTLHWWVWSGGCGCWSTAVLCLVRCVITSSLLHKCWSVHWCGVVLRWAGTLTTTSSLFSVPCSACTGVWYSIVNCLWLRAGQNITASSQCSIYEWPVWL